MGGYYKMVLKEIQCDDLDWFEVPQVRVQRRVVANTVMKIWVPWKDQPNEYHFLKYDPPMQRVA
jgi:hypothetical protein